MESANKVSMPTITRSTPFLMTLETRNWWGEAYEACKRWWGVRCPSTFSWFGLRKGSLQTSKQILTLSAVSHPHCAVLEKSQWWIWVTIVIVVIVLSFTNIIITLESVYAFQLRVSGVVLQEGVVIQCYVAIREGGLLGHIWINDRARGCVRIVHNMRVCHGIAIGWLRIGLNSMHRWLPRQCVPQRNRHEEWQGIIGNIIWLCGGAENDFSCLLSEWEKGGNQR